MLKVAFHYCPEISLVILKIAIVSILSVQVSPTGAVFFCSHGPCCNDSHFQVLLREDADQGEDSDWQGDRDRHRAHRQGRAYQGAVKLFFGGKEIVELLPKK